MSILRDILLVVGFGGVVAGVYFIYMPAALIVGGTMLIVVTYPKKKAKK